MAPFSVDRHDPSQRAVGARVANAYVLLEALLASGIEIREVEELAIAFAVLATVADA